MSNILTFHGKQRMAQRGLSLDDVAFVKAYGRTERRTGVTFVFLARRDIPKEFLRTHGHLEGVTLILAGALDVVITVYRNREAIGDIKRKHKSRTRPSRRYA